MDICHNVGSSIMGRPINPFHGSSITSHQIWNRWSLMEAGFDLRLWLTVNRCGFMGQRHLWCLNRLIKSIIDSHMWHIRTYMNLFNFRPFFSIKSLRVVTSHPHLPILLSIFLLFVLRRPFCPKHSCFNLRAAFSQLFGSLDNFSRKFCSLLSCKARKWLGQPEEGRWSRRRHGLLL